MNEVPTQESAIADLTAMSRAVTEQAPKVSGEITGAFEQMDNANVNLWTAVQELAARIEAVMTGNPFESDVPNEPPESMTTAVGRQIASHTNSLHALKRMVDNVKDNVHL